MALGDRIYYSRTARRLGRFLDEHWIVRWFVVPILFMGACVFGLGVGLGAFTAAQAAELTVAFLALSFGVVAVGLTLRRIVVAAVSRRRG